MWQQSTDGVAFTNIPNATAATFTPTAAQAGLVLRAVVSFTDLLGSAEQIVGAPTPVIGAIVTGNANANTLTGTAGSDLISGLGGADIINGAGGDDDLQGGAGADTINGGAGNDLIRGGVGNDTVNGQGGDDTVLIQPGDTGIDSIDGGVGQDTFTNTLAAPITLQAISQFETVNGGNRAIVGGDGAAGLRLQRCAHHQRCDPDRGSCGCRHRSPAPTATNVILGEGGNDNINGLGGADTITGGDGNDTLANSVDGAVDSILYTNEAESGPGVAGRGHHRQLPARRRRRHHQRVGDRCQPGRGRRPAAHLPRPAAFSNAIVGDLRWEVVGANTQVQTDTNNNGGVDLRILLAGAPQPLVCCATSSCNSTKRRLRRGCSVNTPAAARHQRFSW